MSEYSLWMADTGCTAWARRMVRALRDTSAMLGAVFASSPAAIFMTDERDRVEIWNPASAEIFGVPDANGE